MYFPVLEKLPPVQELGEGVQRLYPFSVDRGLSGVCDVGLS